MAQPEVVGIQMVDVTCDSNFLFILRPSSPLEGSGIEFSTVWRTISSGISVVYFGCAAMADEEEEE